jgi:hypothetical protein
MPRPTSSRKSGRAPRLDDSENFATLEHERLPPPERLPSSEQQFVTASARALGPAPARTVMVVVMIVGLTIGVMGALAITLFMRPQAPIVVVPAGTTVMTQSSAAAAPQAAAIPATVPAPPRPAPTSPTPVVTSTPLAAPLTACPRGMAELSSPHHFCIDQYEYPGGRTIPRTMIAQGDAAQICAGRGLRLCSDSEWEQACRGPSGASYPYGQHYDGQRCNTGGKSTPQPIVPGGTMAHCRSAAGAYDMSGNVSEWTASGSVRGGSSATSAYTSRCSHCVRSVDPAGGADVGFRCCGDAR